MSTQPGNFTSTTTTVTPSFASTSDSVEVKTEFCTATTSFGLSYNDSPNSITTNSPTRLPVVSSTFSHLAQGKMTPFSTQSSSNTNVINSNIESGAININADLTEAVINFTPVSDTFKIHGLNLTIQTRDHCLSCMQTDQTKHSEKFPSQNDAKDQRVGFNVHPSTSGDTSNSSLGMSSVAFSSENSGITRQSGADDLLTLVSNFFASFRNEEKMKAKESSFQQFRKKVEIKVKDILKQAGESSDAQATSSASKLASNNEFGEFVSTSTTSTTNASCAGDRNLTATIDTNTQNEIESKTSKMQDDFNENVRYEVQQLALKVHRLQMDLNKAERPSRGIKRTRLQEEEVDEDTLLQQEQEKYKNLTKDITNLVQQNTTLVTQTIELKKSLSNRIDQIEDALKDLMIVMTIKEEAEKEKDSENENEDKNEKKDESKSSDTEETNAPEVGMSSSYTVKKTQKFHIISEAGYIGPKLEVGKVTLKFMEELQNFYKKQRNLHVNYVIKILFDVKKLFLSYPTLVDIEIPDDGKFTICGDIHGQYFDLLRIFKFNGFPSPSNPYLFNGDIVDRGKFSVETALTLFGYKLLYPNHVFIARGNHESTAMNAKYGFEDEVNSKYSTNIFDLFTSVFNWLPLAHCFNKKVLVMHGGLFSKDDVTLEEIREIERYKQPPEKGVMCELLWSDPQSNPGRTCGRSGRRGIRFGPDITKNFLEINGLDYIIRSHEFLQEGFKKCHGGKCITVFSAPNYCDKYSNYGAIIILKGKDLECKFKIFKGAPHPMPLQKTKRPIIKKHHSH